MTLSQMNLASLNSPTYTESCYFQASSAVEFFLFKSIFICQVKNRSDLQSITHCFEERKERITRICLDFNGNNLTFHNAHVWKPLQQPEDVKEGRKGTESEPIHAVGSKSASNVCARSSRGC